MTPLSPHDNDLVAPYLLDALEPEERSEFEAHLSQCSECQAEVAELRPVVDILPLAADMVEPPASLRERIIAAVQEDEAAPSRPTLTSIPGGAPNRRDARRTNLPLTVAAVAAAVLIAVLGIRVVQLQNRGTGPQAALEQQVLAAFSAGAPTMAVPGTSYAPAAVGRMVQPPTGQTAYFLVKGLPATPSHKVFQLWLVKGQTPYSAGVFTYGGKGIWIVKVPMRAAGFAAAAVTEEPGPHGSRGPTGVKLLLGRLTA